MLSTLKATIEKAKKPLPKDDPNFKQGWYAYLNGMQHSDNPFEEATREAKSWEKGFNDALWKRYETFNSGGEPRGAGPIWHIILFIGLVVVFFPWSLLILLFIFGWDGTVQIFKGLVVGTVGLVVWLVALLVGIAIFASLVSVFVSA